MHKTFKKSIACLLAMLMILTTMPFTAFATTANRDWWVADGIDPSTIKEEPEYWGYNSDERYNQEFGSWALAFGEVIDLSDGSGKEDHRDHYKPIMAVTTSLIGHNGDAVKDLKTASTAYYGASAAKTYDVVDAAGNILNPTQLKAGQRIAVSIEFGGFDAFQVGQLKGYYDNTKLKTAYYKGTPSRADTWTDTPADSSVAWIKTGAAYYGEQLQFAGANSVTDVGNNRGSFYLAITAVHAVNGNDTQSAFLGTGANDPDGARPFGKYGIYCGTLSFEVLQDCSLKDAFWFETRDMANYIEGTTLRAYAANTISDGLTEIAFGNNKDTFAHPWLIWSKDESASAECTHANTEVQNAVDATCTVDGYTGDTVCKDCGATVSAGTTIPATGHNLSKVDEVPSTCTVKGTAAYWTCTECDKMFSDAAGTKEISAPAELPLADHDYEITASTAGDCQTKGTTTYTCKNCPDTYTKDEAYGPHGAAVSADNAVAATCTTDGKEADMICPICHEVLTAGATIKATGHSLSKVNEVPSTCTVKGTAAYWTCTECDKMFSDAAGTKEISAPTELPLAAHDYEITASTAGDCQTKGTTTYTCKNCPDTYTKDDAYGPHGAAVSADNAVAATCTTDGKEADMICPICKEVLTAGATIKATGHSLTEVNEVPSTCTVKGTAAYWTCTECDKMFSDAAGTKEISAPVELPLADHTPVSANNAVDATLDAPGKEADTICDVCKKVLETGATIPALKGYTVTVDAVELGAVTLDGADATNGTSKKVVANSTVTLEATPVEGADFEGWYVGTKKVADGTTYEATVVADVTITPVFTTTTEDEFTVIFMDNFGNIIDTQKVASGADIVEPTAPVRMGYTFAGWSMTEAEIDALTSAATIKANYVKDVVTTYTVTATGCVITVNGVDYNDVATGITYNTKVTVTKEGTDVWTIDGAEAAYGDTYTFYVGSNIEVVPVTNPSAVPMATVVNVSKTAVAGTTKYTYLATRSVPAGYTVVSSGFIYGKGVDTDPANMILDNVGNGYLATYTKTTSAQFSITVGTKSTGTYIAVRAFVVCKDNKGNILAPVYADVVSTNY